VGKKLRRNIYRNHKFRIFTLGFNLPSHHRPISGSRPISTCIDLRHLDGPIWNGAGFFWAALKYRWTDSTSYVLMNIYGVSWYLRMFLFFPILSFGMNVGGWSLSDPFPAIWNESHWNQWEEFSIMILPKCGDGKLHIPHSLTTPVLHSCSCGTLPVTSQLEPYLWNV